LDALRSSVQEIEVVQKDHDRRITALEKNDVAMEGRQANAEARLKTMEEALLEVKTTVITESQKMREGYEKTTERVFSLVEQQGSYKEASAARGHAEVTQQNEYRKVRFERVAELLGKFGLAGGILYVFIDALIASFMK